MSIVSWLSNHKLTIAPIEKAAPTTGLRTVDGGYGPWAVGRFGDFESFLQVPKDVHWVRSAIDVKARSLAAVPIHVYDARGEEIDPENPNEFVQLLDRPNAWQDRADFLELLVWYLDLTGNAIVALDAINALGQPANMFLLRPSRVGIVRGRNGPEAYEYRVNQDVTRFEPDEIIHPKYPNPTDEFWGLGPTESAARALNVELAMTEYQRSFFQNNATPFGVLKAAGSVRTEKLRAVADMFRANHQGSVNAGRMAVLDEGMDYVATGADPTRNMLIEQLNNNRDRILPNYGVPKHKLGLFEQANRAQSEAADNFFAAETLNPLCKRLERFLNQLADRYDCYVEFENQDVQDADTDSQIVNRLVPTKSFTVNEIREMMGREPFPEDDPRGDVLVAPGGGAAPTAEPELPAEEPFLALASATEAAKAAGPKAARLQQAQLRTIDAMAAEWTPRLQRQFANELDAVVERINTSGKKSGQYSFDADDVYPVEEAQRQWMRLLLPLYGQVGNSAATTAASTLGFSVTWDVTNPDIARFVEGIARRPSGAVTSVSETTRDAIRTSIAEGQRRGYSTTQLVNGVNTTTEKFDGIRQVFKSASEHRAEMIVRTEVASSYNLATTFQAKQAGIDQYEVVDGTEDDACAEANGQTWTYEQTQERPIEHPFCYRLFVPKAPEEA